jgi:UDP-N-acetyl-D-glucosamine dehydrogenase
VTKPEVAEAAKLLENSFRQVNIALVNELSEIVKAYKISANETISAAATKPFGFMPFYPSIGVGGHCIPIDPSYLIYSAKQVGLEAEIITLANEINLSRPEKVVKLIKGTLHGDLERKVIQVAGITYKPNISDLRESPALKLIKELEKNGANVIWFDPFIQIFEGKKSQPLSSQIDLGLIVTPHDNIDFSVWRKSNTQVLDLTANSKNYGWPKFL